MELKQILEKAKDELATVTGLKPGPVTQVFKDDEGWHVRAEMVEMSRIPPATDLLGVYAVVLSEAGDVVSFERTKTRLRGSPEE